MLIDEKGFYSSVLRTQAVLPPDDVARRVPPKLLPSKLRSYREHKQNEGMKMDVTDYVLGGGSQT